MSDAGSEGGTAAQGKVGVLDVPAGATLRTRHRNNPNGVWLELAALELRPSQQHQVQVLIDGAWLAVDFAALGAIGAARAQGGRREGSGRKPLKAKGKKTKAKKLITEC